MQHVAHVREKEITYTLRQSRRTRHMRVSIYYNGDVVVTAPQHIRQTFVKQFVASKSWWILKKLASIQFLDRPIAWHASRQDYARYKMSAKFLAEKRLGHFSVAYGLSYSRISIRNQTTRWGSCSRDGNLNFNYRIALLPSHLSDYIIVHELCHRAELNHSRRFWDLVAKTIPHYTEARKELRQYGY